MSNVLKKLRSAGTLPLLLVLYVVFQPVLDALTSLAAEAELPITLGAVVRVLFIAGVYGYVLFTRESYPERKRVLVYVGLLTAYLGLFAIWSLVQGGFGLCLENGMEAMKVFYTLFTMVLLYVLYCQKGWLLPLWAVAASGAGYCLIILVAFLTGTSFVSYNAGYGYCGWFYSANDISNIILLSAPVLLHLCMVGLNRRNLRWYAGAGLVLVLFSVVFSASFLGTKLVYLGVALYLAAVLVWHVVRLIQTRDKIFVRGLVISVLLCALLGGLYPVSPLNAYMNDIFVPMSGEDQAAMEASQQIPGVKVEDRAKKNAEIEKAAEGTWLGERIKTNPLVEKLNWILSRRLLYIAPILQEYLDGGPWVQIFGLGYGQTPAYEKDIGQLVEMEGLMTLLRHGIVGFVLCYLPCLAAAWVVIWKFFRRMQQMKSLGYCSLLYSAMIALAASLVVGHVIQAPSVCMLAVPIYAQLLCRDTRNLERSDSL